MVVQFEDLIEGLQLLLQAFLPTEPHTRTLTNEHVQHQKKT